MSHDHHHYALSLAWTPGDGGATTGYRAYSRDHEVTADGVGTLPGTADIAFRGVRDRWNPEQLFLASIAQCHLLTYLWLCVGSGIVVTGYDDSPTATMTTHPDGSGEVTEVTLRPRVRLAPGSDATLALALHGRVHEYCFIARSVRVPIALEPAIATN
ncbi:MAG TPA: OsmC family protein [Propionicimonas sp.]|nr:OsmC family protein [Propionicimonas sp.]